MLFLNGKHDKFRLLEEAQIKAGCRPNQQQMTKSVQPDSVTT
jgi:hypothetical protein